MPYIKGTAKLPRTRKTSIWDYKQVPAMFMPAHVKVSEDHSKYFIKTPAEMSRFEIAELEQLLREIDEPEDFVPDEEMLASEEFKELKDQMVSLQPIRHGIIKRYFEKFKFQKKKRELLLQLLEESEEHAAEILSPSGEFVPYYEAIPEIKNFLIEIEAREKLAMAEKGIEAPEGGLDGTAGALEKAKGIQQEEEEKDPIEEVEFDPEKFNPFDRASIRREEAAQSIKPKQARKVFTYKK